MSSTSILGPGGGTPFHWGLAEGCGVAPDRSEGVWLEESLIPMPGHGLRLHHLVPPVYERYARILYPARDTAGRSWRWRDVAEFTGRVIHPEVQWESLLRGPRGTAPSELRDPGSGQGDWVAVSALKRLLVQESKPNLCWLAAWHGYAGLEESFDAPRVTNGIREYLLLRVAPDAVDDPLRPSSGPLPGIWWPDDRSFCVGTDTDISWSYVGGSSALIERLLEATELEALEVDAEHRGDYTSDQINGPVRP